MEDQALDQAPIWDDLTTFPSELYSGKVDIISAGFPCQPFSVAGKRKGTEDERWLWPAIERIISQVGPGILFLENVPGLFTDRGGIGAVLGSLAQAGFNAEWGCFTAAEVGASHRRQRAFILGYAPGLRQQGFFQVREKPGSPAEKIRDEKGVLRYGTSARSTETRNSS